MSGTSTEKSRKKSKLANAMATTSKQIMWILIINSILWIWCSYLLAFLGHDQIAEALSSNVCTVIIGQIIGYFIKSTIENVFKNNNFTFISPKEDTDYEPEFTGAADPGGEVEAGTTDCFGDDFDGTVVG